MKNLKTLTISALCFALGLVLPFLTMQIQAIGNMLLPMHLPVLMLGFICGPIPGLIVGLLVPITRSVLFGMPPLYPTAIAMCAELATYGLVTGFLYHKVFRHSCIIEVYKTLIIAMIAGRIVNAFMNIILLGINGKAYTFKMFITANIINSIPGIILQLIVIPALLFALNKTKLVTIYKKETKSVTETTK